MTEEQIKNKIKELENKLKEKQEEKKHKNIHIVKTVNGYIINTHNISHNVGCYEIDTYTANNKQQLCEIIKNIME